MVFVLQHFVFGAAGAAARRGDGLRRPDLPARRRAAAFGQYGALMGGNFIGDDLKGGPIQVKGDGTPLRSYLYAADLAVWLWTILLRGESCRPYNVGASEAISIAELAQTVAECVTPRSKVVFQQVPQPGLLPARYVPATERARAELGLTAVIPIPEAIRRTAEWARLRPAAKKDGL